MVQDNKNMLFSYTKKFYKAKSINQKCVEDLKQLENIIIDYIKDSTRLNVRIITTESKVIRFSVVSLLGSWGFTEIYSILEIDPDNRYLVEKRSEIENFIPVIISILMLLKKYGYVDYKWDPTDSNVITASSLLLSLNKI